MSTPRPARQLIAAAFGLYRRYPLLFFVLATGVVVPYELIALATTGSGNFSRATAGLGAQLLLGLISWVLVGPLISALHVHAVAEVKREREPELVSVARQGLKALPVVAAATIISGLGIALGFVALIVPGVILAFRWVVVAQVAAIENEGWPAALHRSRQLSAGNYRHIFGFFLYLTVIVSVPAFGGGIVFGHHDTSATSFLVGLLVHVFTASFGALATALLFYDLLARREASAAQTLTEDAALVVDEEPQVDRPWDPRKYSNQDRPQGWYVDPSSPNEMRYWGAGDPPGWEGTTRTPRKIRRAWRAKEQTEDHP